MMDDRDKPVLPIWLLPALSWVVAIYFIIDFVCYAGFLPDNAKLVGHASSLFLSLFFLLLPFFSKVKIGKVLEIEREVDRTKREMQDFKTEMRNNLAVISTSVNTISNISNQITVNIPNVNELREVRKEIEEKSKRSFASEGIQDDLERMLQREDPTLALAWTRIEMERLLRRILGKRTDITPNEMERLRMASLTKLFNSFTKLNPGFQYLNDAFQYVSQVCNAAIHGQTVSAGQAREALGLGGQVIFILKGILGEGPSVVAEPGGGGGPN